MIGKVVEVMRAEEGSTVIRKALVLFLVGIVLFQFASYCKMIFRYADKKAMIVVFSDDSCCHQQIAMHSRWWNDNEFRPYGPLYYRLGHSLATVLPRWLLENARGLPLGLATEVRHCAALLLINLLSLYGLSMVFAMIATPSWCFRWLTVALMPSLILNNAVWRKFLFLLHPEMLFAFLMCGTLLATYMATTLRRRVFYTIAGVLLGLAACVKLTVLFFAPALAILLIDRDKDFVKNLILIGVTALVVYFAAGIYQNFKIGETLNFMNGYSTLAQVPASADFVSRLKVFLEELWRPGIFLLGLSSLYPLTNGTKTTVVRVVSSFLMTLLIFSSFRTVLEMDHYFFSVVVYGLGVLILIIRLYVAPLLPKISAPFCALLVPLLFGGMVLFGGSVPSQVRAYVAWADEQKKQYRAFYDAAMKARSEGKIVLADPYTPVDPFLYDGLILRNWGGLFTQDVMGQASYLLFNKKYYSRYVQPEGVSDYVRTREPDWLHIRDYYRSFVGRQDVVDLYGLRWRQVMASDTLEWWKKE